MLWIILVLIFAILVGAFLLKGGEPVKKSGCSSCPNAKKNPEVW